MPLLQTQGAGSVRGYGENLKTGAAVYIEDVFSTYLYTGNGSTQTITNGIDLSGKGGLIWNKCRSTSTLAHWLWDTVRSGNKCLTTSGDTSNFGGNGTNASTNFWAPIPSTTGYSFSGSNGTGNSNLELYVSWTFRKQPKFFDVVTYAGDGSFTRDVAHNLGAVPGFIIIKATSATGNWYVAARTSSYGGAWFVSPSTSDFGLNLTNSTNYLVAGTPFTAATVRVNEIVGDGGTNAAQRDKVNANGVTYVMYLFANNAGGFGASGADNVISCDGYTGNGSATGPVVTLGYEPQWLLIKRASGTGDWNLIDNMRGFAVGGTNAELNPNLSNAESTGVFVTPTATGFRLNTTDAGYNANGNDYIYIAIRRGPMKTPTVGTSVFMPNTWSGTGTVSTGFPVDFLITLSRGANIGILGDRLRGSSTSLCPQTSDAEGGYGSFASGIDSMNSVGPAPALGSTSCMTYAFRRSASFFDVVCYTGTGVTTTINHNLSVVPELMIVKSRSSGAFEWQVYSGVLANTEYLVLNTTAAKATGATRWNSTTPTNAVFSLGTASQVNTSSATYVAYLFATVAGVSKVGSYTGNGSSQTINCNFTAGARFILIKRTNSTGDWYVWDSARGIIAGNDPHLSLNTTAAEVTTDDSIDTDSTGFIVNQLAATNINVTSATYIFLAIA